MYVLFITKGYPTEKYLGNGIFEFDQAKALHKAGCKVIYAFVDVRSIRRWRKWGFERKNIDGVELYGVNIPLGRVSSRLLDKASIFGLNYIYEKIIKEHGKPDILHAHFTDLGYSASVLKRRVNIPLVITEHSSKINKLNIEKGLYKKALKAYNSADALIAVSPALADKINKNFHIRPMYIPNIVDTETFNFPSISKHDKFKFVSTGNLIYTKRMDLTIEAFYQAFADNKAVTLCIFGEGPERLKLQELIDKYELNDRVILKGMCSRSIIAKELSESDCFVLASQTETFGVAYIEALAMGIPVIGTKCGGPEGFVNDSNGVLIAVDNINELTKELKYMYKNSHKFNRKEISNQIKNKYSPESISKILIDLYCKIIQ